MTRNTRRIQTGSSLAVVFVFLVLASLIPACRVAESPSEYTAVMPAVWHSGMTENISVVLTRGPRLAADTVEVTLLGQGKTLASRKQGINGKGSIDLSVPLLAEGDYEVQIKGTGFTDRALVKVQSDVLTFLESDKPIYKPGQTVHLRIITLNSELKPLGQAVSVDVLDAKGIKVFRSETQTDDYGMATLDLPLSTEPNLGVWKISATTGKAKTQLDIRVEKYVLPKYEVKLDLPKSWFLASESITGKVSAEYSFGKPVSGDLEIKAFRYVGEWKEYATFVKPIDGEVDFNLPAVGYVAGTPAAGGQGNIRLDVVVTEKATGYEERTSELLTVAQAPVNIQIIPEGSAFKPGLSFGVLLITETPDNKPVDAKVSLNISYFDPDFKETMVNTEATTAKGKAMVELIPPANSISLVMRASTNDAQASKTVNASYSPSGNFVQLEQTSEGIPQVGQEITFRVHATAEAANFYYEVVSRGRVVFSDYTRSRDITLAVTPLMAPSAKLLVYQILPNSEVAADYLTFSVDAEYPHKTSVEFSKEEAKPGERVEVNIRTEGQAEVGVAAVDKSVFILAENRLNLQQIFDELERLYMKPQVEIHDFQPVVTTMGASEIFKDAGVVVLSNNRIPNGKEYKSRFQRGPGGIFALGGDVAMEKGAPPPMPVALPVPAAMPSAAGDGGGLAEVQRIRQFFPETWIWQNVVTDAGGKASLQLEMPDSITTWMLRAISISKELGLGISDAQIRAFQPFFMTVDLPYSAIRGEEFSVSVAIYNYLSEPQKVQVQLQKETWFDLLDNESRTVEIGPNDIGGAAFKIRPAKLGLQQLNITARSTAASDAVVKQIVIDAEGVARELVQNLVLAAGKPQEADTSIPQDAVPNSGRVYLAVTGSFLTQTLDGLEGLIQMPFGCGEQNMILFAPDVFVTRYLRSTGQLKPEIMAKAEKLMITGYQRELTYMRTDGSFSAFGQNDREGSLWLTAFVLKSFAQARDIVYIDEAVLDRAARWITSQQNNDGSFDTIGFVAHQEMMGGLTGKDALTAYVAIALLEAGERTSSARAIAYLEDKLDQMNDPYQVVVTAYALELAGSNRTNDAYRLLMDMAQEDENGLHWGSGEGIMPLTQPKEGLRPMPFPPMPNKSGDIETTAYATLALIKHKDALNASKAAKWLTSRRNAFGGFGSTQDTVVALQALTEYATAATADVELKISVKSDGIDRTLQINSQNFDVLQLIELPVNGGVEIGVTGKGEAIAQVVRRFNLPETRPENEMLSVRVTYDSSEVDVNDLVTVNVDLEYNPPFSLKTGMVVLDISIPTGFAADTESIDKVVTGNEKIMRYDIAGRKVIFYVDNLQPGDRLSFAFQVKAMYPVKAKGVVSQAYSYYQPEIRGETLSGGIMVR